MLNPGIFVTKLSLLTAFLAGMVSSCKEDNPETVFVESVRVLGEDVTAGISGRMRVVITPEDAENKAIAWASSDTGIAEISQEGVVTGKRNGKVTITATAKDRLTVRCEKEIQVSGFTEDNRKSGVITVNTAGGLIAALSEVRPGDTIFLHEGTYHLDHRLVLSTPGTPGARIVFMGYPGEDRPVLDFSSMEENSSNKGIILKAGYWTLYHLHITKAGDNGMQVTGNNNRIEFCAFSECADTGLQLDDGASDNLILNCDSYFNADASLENADGFAAKLSVGSGNIFSGCRAWQNLDDGWDGYLRGADKVKTIYLNCWAIRNGFGKDGTKMEGDGNGFKTGGSDDKQLSHHGKYVRCLAVGNAADGFDHNSNRGDVTLLHCSAYGNGRNFAFSDTHALRMLTIKNCAVAGPPGKFHAENEDISNNSWINGVVVTEADFQGLDISQLTGPRKKDGSLPDVSFMHLVSGSDLIDNGMDVGLPFKGIAPDLGAFEFQGD